MAERVNTLPQFTICIKEYIMEWLKTAWSSSKVRVSVVGGALVVATAYGTCTAEAPESVSDANTTTQETTETLTEGGTTVEVSSTTSTETTTDTTDTTSDETETTTTGD
jgi:cytoskeletal protein RodZ